MNKDDRHPKVLARARQNNSFRVAKYKEDAGDALNRCTMFALYVAALSAGFWAIACLSKLMFKEGPLSLLQQLSSALLGK